MGTFTFSMPRTCANQTCQELSHVENRDVGWIMQGSQEKAEIFIPTCTGKKMVESKKLRTKFHDLFWNSMILDFFELVWFFQVWKMLLPFSRLSMISYNAGNPGNITTLHCRKQEVIKAVSLGTCYLKRTGRGHRNWGSFIISFSAIY